jgi:dipeptidyl aminopeptidase/acylaminoacyl peptidase
MKANNILKEVINKNGLFEALAIASCLLLMTLVGSVSKVLAQGEKPEFFPVPETYRTEGIPPIRNSEVENLFYDPSAIRSNLIWDTDKRNRRLLVTDETNSVYLLDTPLSPPVKLLEKTVPNTVKVRPDGSSFVYTSDHEDEDNYQLYLYDFKEKMSRKLTTLTGKDESIESIVWNKAGDLLFYTKVDYDSKTSKLCQNNLQSAEMCFPVELKGIWNAHSADGNKVLLKYWKASSSQYLYIYDLQTNKLTPIDEKGKSPKAFMFGDRVFWVSEGNDACGKNECVLSLDLKTEKVKRLNLPENLADFDDVKFSPDGNNLLVQYSKNGIDVLQVFRLKKGKIVKEIHPFVSGSYVIWNTRWLSENEIAYTLENNGKPASIQSYDIDLKKKVNWTKERLPVQLESKVKAPEVLKWKSFDGKEISGFVVRPVMTAKKSPVLIFVHGGPQILDKPVFSSQDIRLASNLGLTIIHTNIRGSSGFGNEFMDADNKEKRGNAVKDIQALLDWVERQPDLDAARICLRGESYGGFVVLSTALQEPTRIKGVIAEYPLVSIRGYLSQSWIDEFAKTEYGDPKDEVLMKKLDELSPVNNVSRWNQIPLFLTRGKLDARTFERDVIDLKNQLQNKGSEVWFIYSTEDGHGFGGKYVFSAMYKFLKKQINEEK